MEGRLSERAHVQRRDVTSSGAGGGGGQGLALIFIPARGGTPPPWTPSPPSPPPPPLKQVPWGGVWSRSRSPCGQGDRWPTLPYPSYFSPQSADKQCLQCPLPKAPTNVPPGVPPGTLTSSLSRLPLRQASSGSRDSPREELLGMHLRERGWHTKGRRERRKVVHPNDIHLKMISTMW